MSNQTPTTSVLFEEEQHGSPPPAAPAVRVGKKRGPKSAAEKRKEMLAVQAAAAGTAQEQQPEWTKAFTRVIKSGDDYDDDDGARNKKTTASGKQRATKRVKMTTTGLSAPSNEVDFAIQIVPKPGEQQFDQAEEIYARHFEGNYTRNLLRDRVMPIVEGESVVSLRDMTWAATNFFAQEKTTTIDPFTGYPIRLDVAYNMYLDEYKKYRFDSFRRVYDDQSRKIIIVCEQDAQFVFETTFAQLSFFQFALDYRFIEHVEARINDIKQHWTMVNEKRRREKQQGLTKNKSKRAPLTEKMPETMEITHGRFEIRY